MKKLLLSTAIAAAVSAGMSTSASAALTSGSILNFDDPTFGGAYGTTVVGGSYFAMDNNGDGIFKKGERTGIFQNDGLVTGTAQAASGSHAGAPDGSETPGFDMAWNFFGNTGLHTTTSPTTVLSASGNTATLDFSGWTVDWSGLIISMGAGGSAGIATVNCAVDCGDTDTYTMDYFATVPAGDPSGFGGVAYTLHLEGTVSAVPVPAAVWLFGSGLLGLVGVARRKAA